MKISASIVLYDTDLSDIDTAYADIIGSGISLDLFLVDNSPEPCIDAARYDKATYIFVNKNIGYGSAHNIAMRRARDAGSNYHFIFNPDIHFNGNTLRTLLEFIESNQDVGCMMPKILNPDGTVQQLCRLLPTPMDLIGRRFLQGLLPGYIKRRNDLYELAFWNYNTIESIPALSGCFMLLRMKTLEVSGFFDERYFMYLEDYDLVRRIGKVAKTVYFPLVEVTHAHAKLSYTSLRSTLWHITSAMKYFNKWGWFRDAYRRRVNLTTLERFSKNKASGSQEINQE